MKGSGGVMELYFIIFESLSMDSLAKYYKLYTSSSMHIECFGKSKRSNKIRHEGCRTVFEIMDSLS